MASQVPTLPSWTLGALGTPRIEALYVVLDQSGAAVFSSEHEADKESAGIGVWQWIRGGRIGLGIASFRYGPNPTDSVCALVGVTSPPGNCVLKVGGTLSRQGDGSLAGALFLTIEDLDGAGLTLPDEFPIIMRRLSLEDFPGALP